MTTSTSATALLLLDFQVGIADLPFAQLAVERAAAALDGARSAQLPVFFAKVGFRPGAPEIAVSNVRFGPARQSGAFQAESSRLIPALQPRGDEPVVDKKRLSAFAGNDLSMLLRANGIGRLVLGGVATSAVVLATALAAFDEDYGVTVLEDACADRDPALHVALMRGVFARMGQVLTVQAWQASMQ